MVKVDRLPSGNYRARVNLGGGKYKSFTGKDKKDVQLRAAQFEALLSMGEAEGYKRTEKLTVGEAIDKYIASKCNVLSPSTVRGYKALRKNCLPELIDMPLSELTPENVQIAVNAEAKINSPKYVRNAHGLLSAAIKQYRPDLKLNSTLPQRKKSDIKIPTEEEVSRIFEASKGTDVELPIYLAACCGLRRSEICGLKWSDINFENDTLNINEAIVLDEDNNHVSKGTKTVAGTRTIKLYPFIKEKLENTDRNGKYVVNLKSYQIYNAFTRILQKAEVNHYRFHDLRHYTVSVMLALNIPKNYIADYMGHETENMIDQVYGHIMASKKTDAQDLLQEYFTKSVTKSVTI